MGNIIQVLGASIYLGRLGIEDILRIGSSYLGGPRVEDIMGLGGSYLGG